MAKRLSKKVRRQLIRRYTLIQSIGELIILLALALPMIPFWPIAQAEANFKIHPPQPTPVVEKEYPKEEFRIVIPKIGVDAPIIADVNSTNYQEYMQALKVGVAHAKGTGKPGEPFGFNENTFLFAHSTLAMTDVPKYNAVFIFLRKLEVGDEIDIIYNTKVWKYAVADKKVVDATDLKYLTESSLEPKLTLQTCDPPGTNFRRLIMTAKPI
jgi:LPXTG-site transpeptidase (sortase) family protein